LERETDQLVYELRGLTEEEIKVVEGKPQREQKDVESGPGTTAKGE